MAQHANPIALRAIRALLDAAHDLTFDLDGAPVTVRVERVDVPWPQPLDGLDEAKDGPWPPGVRVRASWEGGAADLELRTFWWTAQGPYHHLVGITARAPKTRSSVAWITFGIPIQTTLPEGVAEVFADISFQRHKNTGETEEEWARRRDALRWAARAAGLDLPTPAQARLCTIRVPSGALVEPAADAFERLAKAVLVKFPVFARHEPDVVEGEPLYDIDRVFSDTADESLGADGDEEPILGGKLKGVWPMPGGEREYMNTLRDVLRYVETHSPDLASLESYLIDQYNSYGLSSRSKYIRLLKQFGLAKADGGLILLTDRGRHWLQTLSGAELFDYIDAALIGMSELLLLTAEEGVLSPARAIELLPGRLPVRVNWEKRNQVLFRRNWLLSMGLTERAEGGDSLTDAGRAVLTSRAAPSPGPSVTREAPRRGDGPLTLRPAQVRPHLGGLRLPETLLERCCAALTAGRHLLLVGPPGTGKTALAAVLADAAQAEGLCEGLLTATASADWTTFDTIGGYALQQNGSLQFRPGVYPRALKERRWLLIDELNRADVDKAFGELMTVLSGTKVTTPYLDDGQEVIIGPGAPGVYRQPEAFRLITTMNSWDRTSLFRLSAALQRRFAVISVGPPEEADFEALIREAAARDDGLPRPLVDAIVGLFGPQGLGSLRELGPAVALHMIEYIRHRDDSPKGAFGLAEAIELQLLSQLEGVPLRHSATVRQRIGDALHRVGCDPKAQAALEARLSALLPVDELA